MLLKTTPEEETEAKKKKRNEAPQDDSINETSQHETIQDERAEKETNQHAFPCRRPRMRGSSTMMEPRFSLTALTLPGSVTTRVLLPVPATGRESTASGVCFKPPWYIAWTMPGASLENKNNSSSQQQHHQARGGRKGGRGEYGEGVRRPVRPKNRRGIQLETHQEAEGGGGVRRHRSSQGDRPSRQQKEGAWATMTVSGGFGRNWCACVCGARCMKNV